ncbi:hypothetical protein JIN84_15265 [Luteolibacter yonseiensis]|uniref:PepSY domain-containing protein n=1 Tax=Luteolibacter yonseiensis TaxID=1144680 RepID=A0A934V885_9BACT|nr:hypothetical protein [Luteolibacter yonseiensis]MBK1816982.1 hypothetical protein [Luteolibacter yonseiensis]
MRNKQTIRTLVIALALGAGTTFAEEEKDEKIPFASLPAAVQKTIQAEADAKSATIGDVEKETEKGKTEYEAEITRKDGKKFEVVVAEDGSLIKTKADDDKKEEKEHEKGAKEEEEEEDGE